MGRQLVELGLLTSEDLCAPGALDGLRGTEGLAGQQYFSVFSLFLKQQREEFAFAGRSRRPPRDRINCLLSFLYALLRHDCIAALTAAGLDPFVGFLHSERPNRPALALDLMEEFRSWIADRLAITLINRRQIGAEHFQARRGRRGRTQGMRTATGNQRVSREEEGDTAAPAARSESPDWADAVCASACACASFARRFTALHAVGSEIDHA